ncbi:TA system VapC family ribonuclease toxin [Phytoactinopolyspora mesophila]|uniref:Ribonuclease VapC n=1 Tax=Phytoactinopolyspora mesophila TaxID=2650750 RepID=A0A7K3M639_9ACTN|nr:PIN domain-containing protein [Phytoactinopolyspora mesophila]
MIIPDVNLLLYATIDGFPQHQPARAWLEETLNGTTPVGLTSPAVFGFLRLVTNPRVLESPMAITDATRHVRDWLAQPRVDLLTPGPKHLDIALGLLDGMGTAANLTTDAQLAAYAIEERAELHSNDADFGRFADLMWINPLSAR